MLTFEETITKLQNFHDKFTQDMDLRDGEDKGKPHESLDTFVDFDMIDAALHYLMPPITDGVPMGRGATTADMERMKNEHR